MKSQSYLCCLNKPFAPLFLLITCALSFMFALTVMGESGLRELNLKTVPEFFYTNMDQSENVDSMAVWHGPDDQHWLFVTAKSTHAVLQYDAANGRFIRRIGGYGSLPGQFGYPNGISIIDDLMFVVERDNHKVQVFRLPELISLGSFGGDKLVYPYGIYVVPEGQLSAEVEQALDPEDDDREERESDTGIVDITGHEREYVVYVTDSYLAPGETYPPAAQMNHRVKVFEFEVEGSVMEGEFLTGFGDTTGKGVLHKVESIYGDPANNRLFIADEAMDVPGGQNIKIYDFSGKFTGETIGDDVFRFQPEGISLMANPDGSGLWICTDQGKTANYYHLFDRESLDYIASISGTDTLNTDGIWLSPEPMLPRFPKGVLYAIDNDACVSAFSWDEVMEAVRQ